MEQIIAQLIQAIPSTALPIVVTVLGLFYIYKKIEKERNDTKETRDNDSQQIHDDILKMKFEITELQGIVNLHRDKLDSIDKQLVLVNQELVKLNIQVEHLASALEKQNEIMMRQFDGK